MENSSATLLYVQACKFLVCGEDRSSWDQLMVTLPRLRNALTCRVCRGLVVDPVSSRYCQHYVCRACLKKKRALNPGCKWCLDWSKLQQRDGQIRVVLACYKLLCEAIKSSSYYVAYVNDAQSVTIDNLLKEAKLNTDELPKYSSNSKSRILKPQPNMEEMGTEVVSRDQLKTCAREKVTIDVAIKDDGKSKNDAKKILETTINETLEPFDKNSVENLKSSIATTIEQTNDQPQSDAVTNIICNNTNANGNTHSISIEEEQTYSMTKNDPDLIELNGEINNNGAKTHFVHKVKLKNKNRVCLRPRNGPLVQKFVAGRYMRKRKMVQTINKKYRPKKKCKIDLAK